MTPARVAAIGIDLSTTSTGICAHMDAPRCLVAGKREGMARLQWIRDAISDDIAATQATVAVLEGYSMGQARGTSRPFLSGELGGVVRLMLFERGIPYVDVAPATLKLFATGKGKGRKEGVLVAAAHRLGYRGDSSDEADAMWLYALGMHLLGSPVIALPASHTRTLATAVQWPALSLSVNPTDTVGEPIG